VTRAVTLRNLSLEVDRSASQLATAINLTPLVKTVALIGVAGVKDNFARGSSPDGVGWRPLAHRRPSGPGKPLRDTGILMNAVTSAISGNIATIGNNRPQAALQHFGGIVRPRRGKYLAIPATREAKRQSARRFPQPLSFRGKPGGASGVLIDEKGTVQYYLVRSVTIPARPWAGLSETWLKRCDQAALEFLQKKFGTTPLSK
jgi:phage gpG-like protein